MQLTLMVLAFKICATASSTSVIASVSTPSEHFSGLFLPLCIAPPSPPVSISTPPPASLHSRPSGAFTYRGKRVHCHPMICFSFTLQMRIACRLDLHTHTLSHCIHIPDNLAFQCGKASSFKPLKCVTAIHLTPFSHWFLFSDYLLSLLA